MTDSVFALGSGNHFISTIEFVDESGDVAVAPVGEVPVWVSDHPEWLTVTAAADGLSADCVTVGPSGLATVTVTAGLLTGTLAVTIGAGAAVSLSIVPGPESPNV